MDLLEQQVAFIKEVEGMKSVLREAWTSSGRRESTAEHSWRLALLAGLLAPSFHVDLSKTLMMCLIHDLGELYMGDISAVSNPDKKAKHLAEEHDVRRILSFLPEAQQEALMALWREYNDENTEEAKLVKALDKAETIIPVSYTHLDVYKRQDSFVTMPPNRGLQHLEARSVERCRRILSKINTDCIIMSGNKRTRK